MRLFFNPTIYLLTTNKTLPSIIWSSVIFRITYPTANNKYICMKKSR